MRLDGGCVVLKDRFERTADYLRIALTDRCKCSRLYCTPPEKTSFLPHQAILSFEEIRELVFAAADLGIRKIRLTGG